MIRIRKHDLMAGTDKLLLIDGFTSFADVQQWMNDREMNLSQNQRIYDSVFSQEETKDKIKSGWYGNKANYEEMLAGIKQFSDPEKLEAVEKAVTEKIDTKILNFTLKKKLTFSENFGNFSFDRAAQGLYIFDEYYSPSKNKVLDAGDVEQAGDSYRAIADKSPVIRRKEQRDDGTPFYRTSIKNVYAYFPLKNRNSRAVELIVRVGGSAELTGDEMMYCGISGIILGKILSKAGVKLKIKITGLSKFYFGGYCGIIADVKGYHEPLDLNAVAIALSDARFIRYDTYKTLVHAPDEFGEKSQMNLGYPVTAGQVASMLMQSGYYATRDVPEAKTVVMGGVFSARDAIEQVESTIKLLATQFNQAIAAGENQ